MNITNKLVTGFFQSVIKAPLRPEDLSEAAKEVLARINLLEVFLEARIFSPERLWHEFFDNLSAELGSTVQVVAALAELQCSDEDILGLFEIIGYSAKQKTEVLSAAGWSDNRIVAAIFMANNTGEFSYKQKDRADIEVLNFLLASGLNKTRVIAALHDNDCLYPRVLHLLRQRGWSDFDLFQSIIEAGCFNKRTYNILIGLRDKKKQPLWDNAKFMRLMDESGLPDHKMVSLFIGAAVGLDRIYELGERFGWSQGRIVCAYVQAGLPPGIIATTYVEAAKRKIKDVPKASPAELAVEIKASKVIAIKLLEQMTGTDFDVVRELGEQDWPNSDIIDYLLAAEWTPERIIRAMKQSGLTEFYLRRAIKKLADEYEYRVNDYWDDEAVDFWDDLLRQEFPVDEQLAARF